MVPVFALLMHIARTLIQIALTPRRYGVRVCAIHHNASRILARRASLYTFNKRIGDA